MAARTPRVVVITRPTELERLLARHGTFAQAAFALRTWGQDIQGVRERHERFEGALNQVLSQIPTEWRRARVARDQLDRFLFSPEDILVAVGQDGLVANLAKYVDDQPVVGVNPDPGEYAGVLARHHPARLERMLRGVARGECRIEARRKVLARTAQGMALSALNELFIGHSSHQSARYVLTCGGRQERQISSGLIVSTGTGATGWARSILAQRPEAPRPPAPEEARLIYLVREAYASPSSGASLMHGAIGPGETLKLVSQMEQGGVMFGDGIEQDHVALPFGMALSVELAPGALRLVTAA